MRDKKRKEAAAARRNINRNMNVIKFSKWVEQKDQEMQEVKVVVRRSQEDSNMTNRT